jgi:SRSO17 transposase
LLPAHVRDLFNPDKWGLPARAVRRLGEDLRRFWKRFRPRFRTRTRDTSELAYEYWRGQLTMEDARNYTNIERRLGLGDGQKLQQFVSDSPWSKQDVCNQIQDEIRAQPVLQHGGLLILDESSDETAGEESAGAGRQHNGRLGKVELSVTAVALTFAHPATGTWVLTDGELFLQERWFTAAYAERRQKVGLPPERTFATKPELGLRLIRRAQARGLPFEYVACDDLYGKSREFRAALETAHLAYAAEVPGTTEVYLQCPHVGVPRRRHARGPAPTRPRVVGRLATHVVQALARSRETEWSRVTVRSSERGYLVADFSVRSVWTVTAQKDVRREWLVMRRDLDGRLTYVLLNAPETTSPATLIDRSCGRYFTERAYQDAKSELGWADLQARKYRAWEHHLALTAAATWFIASVKLEWRDAYPRDPALARQLELEVLPALSTANVRELLQAVLPLPELTPEQARQVVATHLVHRARSTASRLRT